MVNKIRLRRGEIDTDKLNRAISQIKQGKSIDEVANEFGREPIEMEYIIKKAEKSKKEDSPSTNIPNRSEEDYYTDIQKIISYKGVIRPIDIIAKNRQGKPYKLKILNIYVKPNFKLRKGKYVLDASGNPIPVDNTRYYEEEVYSVDKKAIAKGSNSDNYYPEKARWSKSDKDQIIGETTRKRVNSKISLKRVKVIKPRNTQKCRCIKKR